MIDVTKEKLKPLTQVVNELLAEGTRRIHPSTAHRWVFKGVKGRKLEAVRLGGSLYTSSEAVARFVTALNSDGPSHDSVDGTKSKVKQTLDHLGF